MHCTQHALWSSQKFGKRNINKVTHSITFEILINTKKILNLFINQNVIKQPKKVIKN